MVMALQRTLLEEAGERSVARDERRDGAGVVDELHESLRAGGGEHAVDREVEVVVLCKEHAVDCLQHLHEEHVLPQVVAALVDHAVGRVLLRDKGEDERLRLALHHRALVWNKTNHQHPRVHRQGNCVKDPKSPQLCLQPRHPLLVAAGELLRRLVETVQLCDELLLLPYLLPYAASLLAGKENTLQTSGIAAQLCLVTLCLEVPVEKVRQLEVA
mmetsp:Transcript_7581/g.32044  ORF Transcript_7581/g.32044 Transcript_7581/m.32044 type:complete len:215 (-) Transcript_7581:56-700(-)